MGEYAKAEPLLKETLEIDKKVHGRENPQTALQMQYLATLELQLGEIQEARRLGQSSSAILLKAFSNILSFGSENQRLAYEDNHVNPYTLFADLDEPDALAGAILHYKGVVLDSIIEDRLLAETNKREGNRDLVEQLYAKK
jgi:hypothetical protein